tara:strand:+ start:363 stop:1055 length:693 start_codon:yes stop_codon:yes gene_type:complete
MADEFKIEVHKRDLSNKKSDLKLLRKDEKIPGVFYSFDSEKSVPLYIEKQSFRDAGKSGAKIFNISVGKDKKNVIFKSIQYHPVTDEVLHIDLYGVDMNRAVTVKVSIHLIGNAKGVLEEGGILVQSLNELEIECLPSDIPDSVEVDISNLNLGDAMKVGDISLSEKLELKTNENQTIASVTHAMKEEELAPVTEEDEEFMEEGTEGTEESTSEDSPKEGDEENKENTEG